MWIQKTSSEHSVLSQCIDDDYLLWLFKILTGEKQNPKIVKATFVKSQYLTFEQAIQWLY